MTTGSSFSDDFTTFDTNFWSPTDLAFSGNFIDTAFAPQNVIPGPGTVTLELNTDNLDGKNFTGGEFRTIEDNFWYGTYSVDLQITDEPGVLTSFFLFTGEPFGDPRSEIDFEFLSNDTTEVLVTVHTPAGSSPQTVALGFDAAAAVHTYSFEWGPESIRWFADGVLLRELTSSTFEIPEQPGAIFSSIWTGNSNSFTGIPTFTGSTTSTYSEISFQAAAAGTDTTADANGNLSLVSDPGNALDASHVSASFFTLSGLDGDATAVVTVTDGVTTVSQTYTENGTQFIVLWPLADGPLTSSITATDTSGNSVTIAGPSLTLDTSTGLNEVTQTAQNFNGTGASDLMVASDTAFGTANTIRGNNGNDFIFGGAGNDLLRGENDADQLFGEAGNDRLEGGNGPDRLEGGTGNDVLRGNAGPDAFVWEATAGANLGTDRLPDGFFALEGDRVFNTGDAAATLVLEVASNGEIHASIREGGTDLTSALATPEIGTIEFERTGLDPTATLSEVAAYFGGAGLPAMVGWGGVFIDAVDDGPDTSADEDGNLTLVAPDVDITASEVTAVTFTVTGIDADADALVEVTDGVTTVSGALASDGSIQLDLSPLNDGPLTSSVTATDDETPANTATVSGPSLTLDTLDSSADEDGNLTLLIPDTDITIGEVTDVTFTVTGIDADADALVEVTDGVTTISGALTEDGSVQLDLSPLNNGPLTTSVTATDDETPANTATVAGPAMTLDKTDTSADEDGNLTLSAPDLVIDASEVTAVTFTVTGIDADADALVEVTDGVTTISGALTEDGSVQLDLSALNEGLLSTSVTATDDETPANTATVAGPTLTLDTVTPPLSFAGETRALSIDMAAGTYSFATTVLPIGDSLTLGRDGDDATIPDSALTGYRDDLFDGLLAEGVWIDYVGQLSSPDSMLDPAHSGDPGRRLDQIAGNASYNGPARFSDNMALNPDVVLFRAGTNDVGLADNLFSVKIPGMVEDIEDIVAQFAAMAGTDPNKHLIFSSIPPKLAFGTEERSRMWNEGFSIDVNDDDNDGDTTEEVVGDNGTGTYVKGMRQHVEDQIAANPGLNIYYRDAPFDVNDIGTDDVHYTDAGYARDAEDLLAFLENEIGFTGGTLNGTAMALGAGNDIEGGEAGDLIRGSANADTISGRDGNDALEGGAGDDILSGDAGRDLILGGAGADTTTGGTGDDIFGFEADFANGQSGPVDLITDFGDGNDSLQFPESFQGNITVADDPQGPGVILTILPASGTSGTIVVEGTGAQALKGTALGGGSFALVEDAALVTYVNTDDLTAANDTAIVAEDGAIPIDVLANDTTVSGTLSVLSVGTPANGSAVLNGAGGIDYTPNANFNGQDSFTYLLSDGQGGTDSALVTVTVTPVNDDPVALDDIATVSADVTSTIDVLANDSDIDGTDVLSILVTSGPSNGTAFVNAQNEIEYTPTPGFNGDDSLTYELSDGQGGTDTATLTLTVGLNVVTQTAQNFNGTNDDDLMVASDTAFGINNVIQGRSGNDVIFGNAGNDQLRGQNGNDLLIGGTGNDQLLGLNDDDTLEGGEGNDVLRGGDEADTFRYEATAGANLGTDRLPDGLDALEGDVVENSGDAGATLVLEVASNGEIHASIREGGTDLASALATPEIGEIQFEDTTFDPNTTTVSEVANYFGGPGLPALVGWGGVFIDAVDDGPDTSADEDGNLTLLVPDTAIDESEVTAVTFTVTGIDADADALVEVTDGVTTVSGALASDGSIQLDLSGLNDGPLTSSVTATDDETPANTATVAGPGLTLDTTDTSADADGNLALTAPDTDININEFTAVTLTVSGLDADATALVEVTDGVTTVSGALASDGSVQLDFSSLNDGPLTTSVTATDDETPPNTATVAGPAMTLDKVTTPDTSADEDGNLAATVPDTDIDETEASAVSVTVTGIDADASAEVTLIDSVGGSVSATLASDGTVLLDLTGLTSGTVTGSVLVTDDEVPANTASLTLPSITLDNGTGGLNVVTQTAQNFSGTNDDDLIVASDTAFGINNVISGRSGNDVIFGNAGNDQLRGQNGNDQLIGGTGNDQLLGLNDDDTLEGGEGNDVLRGGDEADDFVYNAQIGADLGTDRLPEGLDAVEGDRLVNSGDAGATLVFTISGDELHAAIHEGGTDLASALATPEIAEVQFEDLNFTGADQAFVEAYFNADADADLEALSGWGNVFFDL